MGGWKFRRIKNIKKKKVLSPDLLRQKDRTFVECIFSFFVDMCSVQEEEVSVFRLVLLLLKQKDGILFQNLFQLALLFILREIMCLMIVL